MTHLPREQHTRNSQITVCVRHLNHLFMSILCQLTICTVNEAQKVANRSDKRTRKIIFFPFRSALTRDAQRIVEGERREKWSTKNDSNKRAALSVHGNTSTNRYSSKIAERTVCVCVREQPNEVVMNAQYPCSIFAYYHCKLAFYFVAIATLLNLVNVKNQFGCRFLLIVVVICLLCLAPFPWNAFYSQNVVRARCNAIK